MQTYHLLDSRFIFKKKKKLPITKLPIHATRYELHTDRTGLPLSGAKPQK